MISQSDQSHDLRANDAWVLLLRAARCLHNFTAVHLICRDSGSKGDMLRIPRWTGLGNSVGSLQVWLCKAVNRIPQVVMLGQHSKTSSQSCGRVGSSADITLDCTRSSTPYNRSMSSEKEEEVCR